MALIQKVTCFPNEGAPQVIEGDPAPGDIVRITTPSGTVAYQRYTPPELLAPLVASETDGRDLTWDEFLDVGMATDATKTNAILLNMPVVAEYGRKYVAVPGIQFADASVPGNRLSNLMAAAKAAGLINDAFLASFIGNWILMYPKMVVA